MKDKVYNDYYNKIYYWSLNKTKSKENAKDLLNDIFVEIFIFLNKNIEIKNVDKLIWTIAYNTWKNRVRKMVKEKAILYDEQIINNIGINEDNIDKMIYKDIINNLIIYKLTDNEINCFNLYYKDDLSLNEISDILNISVSNIKYYLYNSRKKIKEIYNDKREY